MFPERSTLRTRCPANDVVILSDDRSYEYDYEFDYNNRHSKRGKSRRLNCLVITNAVRHYSLVFRDVVEIYVARLAQHQ